MKAFLSSLILICLCILPACSQPPAPSQPLLTGAQRTERYLPLLEGKKVGILCNHTALVDGVHLVDTLLALGVNIQTVFAPEHGFRGDADAGETVGTYRDPATDVEVFSVYGTSKKPPVEKVRQCDVILFDIQDVGLRFYTYLSSMHYMMESCAEAGTPLVVLDRPNPNGSYMDGPILDTSRYSSFVGMHPIPVVHGMTLGELALMINGEGWLEDRTRCDLTVVDCSGYTRDTRYRLPVAPSPNLPNMRSVYLYPSLCPFEGTPVSVGRGTDYPFQVYGHPGLAPTGFTFIPRSRSGAKNPPLKDKVCNGVDLRRDPSDEQIIAAGLDLSYVVTAYQQLSMGEKFFGQMFQLLMGTDNVKKMIIEGRSAEQIKQTWQPGLDDFAQRRKPYLIYD